MTAEISNPQTYGVECIGQFGNFFGLAHRDKMFIFSTDEFAALDFAPEIGMRFDITIDVVARIPSEIDDVILEAWDRDTGIELTSGHLVGISDVRGVPPGPPDPPRFRRPREVG